MGDSFLSRVTQDAGDDDTCSDIDHTVYERLVIPHESMAGRWLALQQHARSASPSTEHKASSPVSQHAAYEETGDGEGSDAYLLITDPVLLALWFQQLGRAQPSTLGIVSLLWVPLRCRSTGTVLGIIEFWNRVPFGWGLGDAAPLCPTPLAATTAPSGGPRGGASTTPSRHGAPRRGVSFAATSGLGVAAVDEVAAEGPTAPAHFHEGDLAVLSLLGTPISIALQHAAYFSSTKDDVAAMSTAVDRLNEQIQASQARAMAEAARGDTLLRAVQEGSQVATAAAEHVAGDCSSWPALRHLSGLPPSVPTLSGRTLDSAHGGSSPPSLSGEALEGALAALCSAARKWAASTAVLLLGDNVSAKDVHCDLWVRGDLMSALQPGSAQSEGEATLWTHRPTHPSTSGRVQLSGGAQTLPLPVCGLLRASLQEGSVVCCSPPLHSHSAFSAEHDSRFGIADASGVLIVPLSAKAIADPTSPADLDGGAIPALGAVVLRVGTGGDPARPGVLEGAQSLAHTVELFLAYLCAMHAASRTSAREAAEQVHWFKRLGGMLGASVAHKPASHPPAPAHPLAIADESSAPSTPAASAPPLLVGHWAEPRGGVTPRKSGGLLSAASFALAKTLHGHFMDAGPSHPVRPIVLAAGSAPSMLAHVQPQASKPGPGGRFFSTRASVTPHAIHLHSVDVGLVSQVPTAWMKGGPAATPQAPLPLSPLRRRSVSSTGAAAVGWASSVPDSPETSTHGASLDAEEDGASLALASGLVVLAGSAPAPAQLTSAGLQASMRAAGLSTAGLHTVPVRGGDGPAPVRGSAEQGYSVFVVCTRGCAEAAVYCPLPRSSSSTEAQLAGSEDPPLDASCALLGYVASPLDAGDWLSQGQSEDAGWADVAVLTVTLLPAALARWHHVVLQSISRNLQGMVHMPASLASGDADPSAYPSVAVITTLRLRLASNLLGDQLSLDRREISQEHARSSVERDFSGASANTWRGGASGDHSRSGSSTSAGIGVADTTVATAALLVPLLAPTCLKASRAAVSDGVARLGQVWSRSWSGVATACIASPSRSAALTLPQWLREGDAAWWEAAVSRLRGQLTAHGVVLYRYNTDLRLLEAVVSDMDAKAVVHVSTAGSAPTVPHPSKSGASQRSKSPGRQPSTPRRRPSGIATPVSELLGQYGVLPESCLAGVGALGSAWGDGRTLRQVVSVQPNLPGGGAASHTRVLVELVAFPVDTSSSHASSGQAHSAGVGGEDWCADVAALTGSRISPTALVQVLAAAESGTNMGADVEALVPATQMDTSPAKASTVLVASARVLGVVHGGPPRIPGAADALQHVSSCVLAAQAQQQLQHALFQLNAMQTVVADELQSRSQAAAQVRDRAMEALTAKLHQLEREHAELTAHVEGVAGQAMSARSRVTELHGYVRQGGSGGRVLRDGQQAVPGPTQGGSSAAECGVSSKYGVALPISRDAPGRLPPRGRALAQAAQLVPPSPPPHAVVSAAKPGSLDVTHIMSTLFHTEMGAAVAYASDAVQVSGDTPRAGASAAMPSTVIHSMADVFRSPLLAYLKDQLHCEFVRVWLVDVSAGEMWTHVPFIGSGGHVLATSGKSSVARVNARASAHDSKSGSSSESQWETRFSLSTGLVGMVARTGHALVLSTSTEHPSFDAAVDLLDGGDDGNAMLLPVLLPLGFHSGPAPAPAQRVVGVLQCRNKDSLAYVLAANLAGRDRDLPPVTRPDGRAPPGGAALANESVLTSFSATDVYTGTIAARVLGSAITNFVVAQQAHARFVDTGSKLQRLQEQAEGAGIASGLQVGRGVSTGSTAAGNLTDTIHSQARTQLLLECAAMLVSPTDIASLGAITADVVPTLLGTQAASAIVAVPHGASGRSKQPPSIILPPMASHGETGDGQTANASTTLALDTSSASALASVLSSGRRLVDSYFPGRVQDSQPEPQPSAKAGQKGVDAKAATALPPATLPASVLADGDVALLRQMLLHSQLGALASSAMAEDAGEAGGEADGASTGASPHQAMTVLALPLFGERSPSLASLSAQPAEAAASSPTKPTFGNLGGSSSAFGSTMQRSSASGQGRQVIGALVVQVPAREAGDGARQYLEAITMLLLHVSHVVAGTLSRHALRASLTETLGGAMQALGSLQAATESMANDVLWERSEALAAAARHKQVLGEALAEAGADYAVAAGQQAAADTSTITAGVKAVAVHTGRASDAVAAWLRGGVSSVARMLSSFAQAGAMPPDGAASTDHLACPHPTWAQGHAATLDWLHAVSHHPACAGGSLLRLQGPAALPPAAAALLQTVSPEQGLQPRAVPGALLATLFWLAHVSQALETQHAPTVLSWGPARTPCIMLPLLPASSPGEGERVLGQLGQALFSYLVSLLHEAERARALNHAQDCNIVLRASLCEEGPPCAVLLRNLPVATAHERLEQQRRSRLTVGAAWALLGGNPAVLPPAAPDMEDDASGDEGASRSFASHGGDRSHRREPGETPVVLSLFEAQPADRPGQPPMPGAAGVELVVLPGALWEALQMSSTGGVFVPSPRDGTTQVLVEAPRDEVGQVACSGSASTRGAQHPQTLRVKASYAECTRACSARLGMTLDSVLCSSHLPQTTAALAAANDMATVDGTPLPLPALPLPLVSSASWGAAGAVTDRFSGFQLSNKGAMVPLQATAEPGLTDDASDDEGATGQQRWVAHAHALETMPGLEHCLGELRLVWAVPVVPSQASSTEPSAEESKSEWVHHAPPPSERVLPLLGSMGSTPPSLHLSIPAVMHLTSVRGLSGILAHHAVVAWHHVGSVLRHGLTAATVEASSRSCEALTQLSAVATRDSAVNRAMLGALRVINNVSSLPMLAAVVAHFVPAVLKLAFGCDAGLPLGSESVGGVQSATAGCTSGTDVRVRAALFVQRRVMGQCNAEKEAFVTAADPEEYGEVDDDDEVSVISDSDDEESGTDVAVLGSSWGEWVRVTPAEVDGSAAVAAAAPIAAHDATLDTSGAGTPGLRSILKRSSGPASPRGAPVGGGGGVRFGGEAPSASAHRSMGALLSGNSIDVDDIATEDGSVPSAGGAVGRAASGTAPLVVTSTSNADVALFPAERLLHPLGAVATLPLPSLGLRGASSSEEVEGSPTPGVARSEEGHFDTVEQGPTGPGRTWRGEAVDFPKEDEAPRPRAAEVVLPGGVTAVLLVATSAANVSDPRLPDGGQEAFGPETLTLLGVLREAIAGSLRRIVGSAHERFQLYHLSRVSRRLQYRLNRSLRSTHAFNVQMASVLQEAMSPPIVQAHRSSPSHSGRAGPAQAGHFALPPSTSAGDDASIAMGAGSVVGPEEEAGYGDGASAVIRMRARLAALRAGLTRMCRSTQADGAEVLMSSEYLVRCVTGNLLHLLPAYHTVESTIRASGAAEAARAGPVSLAAATAQEGSLPPATAAAVYMKAREAVMAALASAVPALGASSDAALLASGSSNVLVPLHVALASLEAALDSLLGEGDGEGGVAWHRLVGAAGEDDYPIVGAPHPPDACLDIHSMGYELRSHFVVAGLGETMYGGGSATSPLTAASSVVSGVDGPSGISTQALGVTTAPATQALAEAAPVTNHGPVGAVQGSWVSSSIAVPSAVVAARVKGLRRRTSRQGGAAEAAVPGSVAGAWAQQQTSPATGDAVDTVLRELAERAGVSTTSGGVGTGFAAAQVMGVSRDAIVDEVASRAVAHVTAVPVNPGVGHLVDCGKDAGDLLALAAQAEAAAAASQQAASAREAAYVSENRSVMGGASTTLGSTARGAGEPQPGAGFSDQPVPGLFSGDDGHLPLTTTGLDNADAGARASAHGCTPFGVVQLITVKPRVSRTTRLAESGSAKHRSRAARAAQAEAQRQMLMRVYAHTLGAAAAGLVWELTSFSVQRSGAARLHRAVAFMKSVRLAYGAVRQQWAAERAQAMVSKAAAKGALSTLSSVGDALVAVHEEQVSDSLDWAAEQLEDREVSPDVSGLDDAPHTPPQAAAPQPPSTLSVDAFRALRDMLGATMAAATKSIPAVAGAAAAVMWWRMSRVLAERCGLLQGQGGPQNAGPVRGSQHPDATDGSVHGEHVWISVVPESSGSSGTDARIFVLADGEGLASGAASSRRPVIAGDASGRDERYEAPEGRALRAAMSAALSQDVVDLAALVAPEEPLTARSMLIHGPAGPSRGGHARHSTHESSIALGTVVCLPFLPPRHRGRGQVQGVLQVVLLRSSRGTSADALGHLKPVMRTMVSVGGLIAGLQGIVDEAERVLAAHSTGTATVQALQEQRRSLHLRSLEQEEAADQAASLAREQDAELLAVTQQLEATRASTARERHVTRLFEAAMSHLWTPLLRPMQSMPVLQALQLAHPDQQWEVQGSVAPTAPLTRWCHGLAVDLGAACVRLYLSAEEIGQLVRASDPLSSAYGDDATDASSVLTSIGRESLLLAAAADVDAEGAASSEGRIMRSVAGPAGDAFERRQVVQSRPTPEAAPMAVAVPLLVAAEQASALDTVGQHVAQFHCLGALYVQPEPGTAYDEAQVNMLALTGSLLCGSLMQYAAWGNMMAAACDARSARERVREAQREAEQARLTMEQATLAAKGADAAAQEARSDAQAAVAAREAAVQAARELEGELDACETALVAVRGREAMLREQIVKYREMEVALEAANAESVRKDGQLSRLQTALAEMRAQFETIIRARNSRRNQGVAVAAVEHSSPAGGSAST